ncbi:octopamine receptor Oamb isoform X1 [Hydra vulgaris]|uniref:octopamine receptor Oamb isoform X1 n=2 Tax=Hydra vulgaris TaxID=6087 RepID=UPI001F5FCA10|nr:octopamine receptor Oamb isoform X1 [Hydra vulgaris]
MFMYYVGIQVRTKGQEMLHARDIVDLIYILCVGFLIISGNALVILAFWKGPRQIRTLTNYFVVNLSFSDLMVGCFSVPFRVCVRLGKTKEGSRNYEYFIALDVLCGTISALCLTAISIERTFAVKYPAMHYNLSKKPVLFAIVMTWIIGLLLAALKLIIGRHSINSPYTLLIMVISFFLPLFIIIVSYVIIFFTAMSVNQSPNLRKEIRVAKTISLIIGLFTICWMPFFIVNILYYYCGDYTSTKLCSVIKSESISTWIVNIVVSLRISNSMMNFFVYAVRSPIFRTTFKSLVFKMFRVVCNMKTIEAKSFSLYKNGSKKGSLNFFLKKDKKQDQKETLWKQKSVA